MQNGIEREIWTEKGVCVLDFHSVPVQIEEDIWPDSLQVSAKVKKQTFRVSL